MRAEEGENFLWVTIDLKTGWRVFLVPSLPWPWLPKWDFSDLLLSSLLLSTALHGFTSSNFSSALIFLHPFLLLGFHGKFKAASW